MPDDVDRLFAEAGVGAGPLIKPDAGEDPDAGPRAEPSAFIVLWPFRNMPTVKEVTTAISRQFRHATDVVDIHKLTDESIRWCVALNRGEDRVPLVVRCEPMQPLPEQDLQHLGASRARWALGVETILDDADPYEDYMSLLRLLARGVPGSPAILDVITQTWMTRRDLNESILVDTPGAAVGESILWVTHGYTAKDKPGANVWLYTSGLSRCGLPELEMLDVPAEFAEAAATALDSIASLILEDGLPEPGRPMEIGRGLSIAIQPWPIAARGLADDAPGGLRNRQDNDGENRTGVSAVVCASEPVTDGAVRWVWPREVVERLTAGDRPIYFSRRATQRMARQARSTWIEFKEAFDSLPSTLRGAGEQRRAAFLFCAALDAGHSSSNDDAVGREHLWFEALRFEDQRVEGRLQNDPALATALRRGDVTWIERDALTDWAVLTPKTRFGPRNARSLQEALHSISQDRHE